MKADLDVLKEIAMTDAEINARMKRLAEVEVHPRKFRDLEETPRKKIIRLLLREQYQDAANFFSELGWQREVVNDWGTVTKNVLRYWKGKKDIAVAELHERTGLTLLDCRALLDELNTEATK